MKKFNFLCHILLVVVFPFVFFLSAIVVTLLVSSIFLSIAYNYRCYCISYIHVLKLRLAMYMKYKYILFKTRRKMSQKRHLSGCSCNANFDIITKFRIIHLVRFWVSYLWFWAYLLPKILKLFGCPFFWLYMYLMTFIPETCRAHVITYLHFYWK